MQHRPNKGLASLFSKGAQPGYAGLTTALYKLLPLCYVSIIQQATAAYKRTGQDFQHFITHEFAMINCIDINVLL